jgi:hypothetical protein
MREKEGGHQSICTGLVVVTTALLFFTVINSMAAVMLNKIVENKICRLTARMKARLMLSWPTHQSWSQCESIRKYGGRLRIESDDDPPPMKGRKKRQIKT